MADAPAPNTHALKIKALELANQHGGPFAPDEVVKRATAYHGFLSGATAAPKPAGAPAGAAPKPGAAAPKPTAAGPKPGGAAPKPAASSPKPAATTAKQTAPGPSDDGLVMDDVSKALRKVLDAGSDKAAGKAAAYKILKDVGGADSVRNVKPDKYKAVIDACEAAVKKPAAKPAAQPEPEDDFGASADDGADGQVADSEVEGDPPEQTGAGEDA